CRYNDQMSCVKFSRYSGTNTGSCQSSRHFSQRKDQISYTSAAVRSYLLYDRTDNQRCKQALRHTGQSVYKYSVQKSFHKYPLSVLPSVFALLLIYQKPQRYTTEFSE